MGIISTNKNTVPIHQNKQRTGTVGAGGMGSVVGQHLSKLSHIDTVPPSATTPITNSVGSGTMRTNGYKFAKNYINRYNK